jgi:hypothetical protein
MRPMSMIIPPEGSGVPEKIQIADRWRQLGEYLHERAPEVFESVCRMLESSIPDENDEKITDGYYLT